MLLYPSLLMCFFLVILYLLPLSFFNQSLPLHCLPLSSLPFSLLHSTFTALVPPVLSSPTRSSLLPSFYVPTCFPSCPSRPPPPPYPHSLPFSIFFLYLLILAPLLSIKRASHPYTPPPSLLLICPLDLFPCLSPDPLYTFLTPLSPAPCHHLHSFLPFSPFPSPHPLTIPSLIPPSTTCPFSLPASYAHMYSFYLLSSPCTPLPVCLPNCLSLLSCTSTQGIPIT